MLLDKDVERLVVENAATGEQIAVITDCPERIRFEPPEAGAQSAVVTTSNDDIVVRVKFKNVV